MDKTFLLAGGDALPQTNKGVTRQLARALLAGLRLALEKLWQEVWLRVAAGGSSGVRAW